MIKRKERRLLKDEFLKGSVILGGFSCLVLIVSFVLFITGNFLDNVALTYVGYFFFACGVTVTVASFIYLAYLQSKKINTLLIDDMTDALDSMASRKRKIELNKTDIVEIDDLKMRYVNAINNFKEVKFVSRKIDESYLKFKYCNDVNGLITNKSFMYNLPYLLKLHDYNRCGLLLIKIIGNGEVTPFIYEDLMNVIRNTFKRATYIGRYVENTLIVFIPDIENIKIFEYQAQKIHDNFLAMKFGFNSEEYYSCKIGGALYPFSTKLNILNDAELALRLEGDVNLRVYSKVPLKTNVVESEDERRKKKSYLTNELISYISKFKFDLTINEDAYETFLKFSKYVGFETCGVISFKAKDLYSCIYEGGDSSTRLFKDRRDIEFSEIAPLYRYKDATNRFYSTCRDDLPSEIAQLFDMHGLKAMYVSFFEEDRNGLLGMSYMISREDRETITGTDQDLIGQALLFINYIVLNTYHYATNTQSHRDLEQLLVRQNIMKYSVNTLTYDLIEVSEELGYLFRKSVIGRKCYKTFANRDTPCENCPLRDLNNNNVGTISINNKEYLRSILAVNPYIHFASIILKPSETNDTYVRYFDTSTHMLSREAFNIHLKEIIDERDKGTMIFVCLQGIERLIKEFGEANLIKVLSEMHNRVKSMNIAKWLFRYQEDIFAIYLEDVVRVDAYDIIENLHEVLHGTPYLIGRNCEATFNLRYFEINFTASGKTYEGTQALIKEAIKDVKYHKDNTLSVAGENILRLASKEEYVMDALRSNYRNKSIQFNIQPIFSLEENRIISGEVLLRIFDVNRQKIFSPYELVQIASKYKRMYLIDTYVSENAIAIYGKYGSNVFRTNDFLGLNINISENSLLSDEWLRTVKLLISSSKLPTHYLRFEIYEEVLGKNFDRAKQWRTELSGLGIYWSIDNYSGEYLSPAQCKEFNIDEIKMSKELLYSTETDLIQKALYESLVKDSKELNMSVVCEGIETREQYIYCKNLGADKVQGYFVARPQKTEEFIRLVESHLDENEILKFKN